ncbi:MAG: hypothetical protein U5S82_22510 [Gammaproteobacteria bacterium]|nr:hypothetical protein [Gammaproteobacteria bacterium]
MMDAPGAPWEQAAPGWGRAGQGFDAPPLRFPRETTPGRGTAPRTRAPDGPGPGRQGTAGDGRGGLIPWDPWFQDESGDAASGAPDPEPEAVPEPTHGAAAGPGPLFLDPGLEETTGDTGVEPSGEWDPPR